MVGLTIPKSIGADLPALPFSNTGSIQDFRTKQSEAERQASEASRKATAAGEREAQLRQAKSAEYEPVMEKIGKRIEEEQAKSVPSLEAIPEYQKTQISPEQTKEAFSTFMAFAMLGGALTRQPMLAAMNNMTAAMKGWQEGDAARAKAELESFDRNFKVAQAKRTGQIEERKAAHEKYKGDLEGLMNAEKQIALKYEDQIAAELSRKGDFNALAKHYDALAKNYETAIHHANQVEQQNRRLAEQEKRDQQRHQEVMSKMGGGKEIFTDPATGKLYHMVNGKIQEIAVPEGAKLQKLDGKGRGGVSGAVAGATERVSSSMTLAADALDILGTMPITTTSPIYGQETFTGIFKTPLSVLNQALSDDITQMMRTNMSGVARNLASLETGGAATGLVGLADKIDKGIAIPSGASLAVALNSLAEMRRIVESSARNALSSPNYTDAQKKLIQQNLEFVRNAIPYTQKELNKAILASKGEGIKLKRGEENMTFTEFMKKYPLDDQAKPQPATESVSSTKPQGAPDTARQAKDGKWYSPDPKRPGKYLEWK